MGFWRKNEKTQEQQITAELRAKQKFARKAWQAFTSPDWQEGVDFINTAIAADKASTPEGQRPDHAWRNQAVSIFMLIKHEKERRALYVLGALDPVVLTDLFYQDLVPRSLALSAKAAQTDKAALPEFLRVTRAVFSQEDLDKALRAAALKQTDRELIRANEFRDSEYKWYHFGANTENAAILLQKEGACLQGDNADLLFAAVEQGDIKLVKTLVEGGADLLATGRKALALAETKKSHVMAQYLQEQIIERERFVKVDAQTLLETKALAGEGQSLKLVFNFESRRVTEIFSSALLEDKGAAMISHRFADYDPKALRAAFDCLTALKGTPRPLAAEPEMQNMDKAHLQKPKTAKGL